VYVSLLGKVEGRVADRPIALGGPHRVAIFALLALRTGSVVPVSDLVDALWDGAPPRSAVANVHGHISALRAAISAAGAELDPGRILRTRPPGYLLDAGHVRTDLAMFEKLKDRAWAARHDHAVAAELYGRALACWQGPALHDVTSPFLRRHADHLEQRRIQTVCDKAEAELALGLHDLVAMELRPLVDTHPYDERLRAMLMLALYQGNRQSDALNVYREGRRALVQDLGLEPGPELRRLEATILAQDRPAVPAVVLAGIRPRQLPPAPPALIGREKQARSLRTSLAATPATALPVVTITGAPGVGKSALALHAAHEMQGGHPDGQLYADLSETVGADQVLGSFLVSVGISPNAVPDGLHDRMALHRTVTADRRILILLDEAEDEAQVRPLLPGGSGCTVIVTGRRALTGLHASASVRLSPLADEDAADLFATLTGRGRDPADLDVIRYCDGLPLAVHAAAALLESRPHWRIRDFADWLGDDQRRLGLLAAGGRSLLASYDRICSGLAEPARGALRLLARSEPGTSTPARLATKLGIPCGYAVDLLEHLVEHRLAEPMIGPGGCCTYELPGLIRLYAAHHLGQRDSTN
jgi:DNA-binding SARP family transcriptional activator